MHDTSKVRRIAWPFVVAILRGFQPGNRRCHKHLVNPASRQRLPSPERSLSPSCVVELSRNSIPSFSRERKKPSASYGPPCQGIEGPRNGNSFPPRQTGQNNLSLLQHDLQDKDLKNARNTDLSDRRSASAEAKATLLAAYRSARTSADPARLARQADRVTMAAAREERRLERERLKRAEAERQISEAAERQAIADATARAEAETRETAERDRITRLLEDEAARKAARDRRYADRKARQA